MPASSPGPSITFGPAVTNCLSQGRLLLYEQCSEPWMDQRMHSVKVGGRRRISFCIFKISSAVSAMLSSLSFFLISNSDRQEKSIGIISLYLSSVSALSLLAAESFGFAWARAK